MLALVILGAICLLAVGRYFAVQGYPLERGGYEYSDDKTRTALALAIVEQPYFGKARRYYRFELREGKSDGRLLSEHATGFVPTEGFRAPRDGPAWPVSWNEDGSITFANGKVEITLKP